MTSGAAVSLFQAIQAASMIWSQVSKTLFESQLARYASAMPHDVFLSYASSDQIVAVQICAALERGGVSVWMAPRDILPGIGYGRAIVAAIKDARVVVLVFSAAANSSNFVAREIELAASNGLPIIPFRIECIAPASELQYFISNTHSFDAFAKPLEPHLGRLPNVVQRVIETKNGGAVRPEGADTMRLRSKPRIFLSYSGSQKAWVANFKKAGIIESHLADASVYDYTADPTLVGQYRDNFIEEIEDSNVFIAVIDNEYTTKKNTLLEFDTAYDNYFSGGQPIPRKAIGLIFLHPSAQQWFESRKGDTRRPFPDDFSYCSMHEGRTTRYIYVDGNPNAPVIDLLKKQVDAIKKILDDEPIQPPREPDPAIVLTGSWAENDAAACKASFANLREKLLRNGVTADQIITLAAETVDGDCVPASDPNMRDIVASNAIFVFQVDEPFADTASLAPQGLVNQYIVTRNKLSGELARRLEDEAARVIYWMPPGVTKPKFSRKAGDPGLNGPGPGFSIHSPDEFASILADRIRPQNPAPPLMYESAPIDNAMEWLQERLTTVFQGFFKPPTPESSAFIRGELEKQLPTIAKAGAGIFIIHEMSAWANSDEEIPEDLKTKIRDYGKQFDGFHKKYSVPQDRVLKIALVRKRDKMWKGRWNRGLEKSESAFLRGWRFLGVHSGQQQGVIFDQDCVAQLAAEVRSLR